ncbi:hypothetical protein MP228_001112 [Amoeboaphelidium protococcarum]|nr:hypothetical protein MP228_001112 [Amoeboaphelidium protococcarum]
MEDPAVTRFREYLRIRTVQPQPDYSACAEFLRKQAEDMSLPCTVLECVKGKPIVVITVQGRDTSLKSLMLNSHTDVVPVFEDKWTCPPFDAHKTKDGNIYARGSQDMKCVGMSYLEAIRRIRADDTLWKPLRTVHIVFVPDEEIGGGDGMKLFIQSDLFKQLNVAFALDEGLACDKPDTFKLYYGERAPWWIKVYATGSVGHGSQFISNTAAEKVHQFIGKVMAFRDAEQMRLKVGRKVDDAGREQRLKLGDVTTVNVTLMNGGVQYNVVPERFEIGLDMRVSPSNDLGRLKQQLQDWCKECDCHMEYVQEFWSNCITPLNKDNVWWNCIRDLSTAAGITLECEIFPAATDSRFLRQAGIPAIGISPLHSTPVLLHDHNEYLNEQVYLDGIKWYQQVIQSLCEVTADQEKLCGKLVV